MRIITHCPEYFVGVKSVFKSGSDLGLWQFESDQSKLADESFLILGAVDHSYSPELFSRANAVLLTSTIGQMELMNELLPFWRTLSRYPDLHIYCGHEESCKALTVWLQQPVEYFPYPIHVEPIEKHFEKEPLYNVGLFLPFSPRKNIYNQISAFFLTAKYFPKLTLHTNLPFAGKGIENYQWLEREEYTRLLSRMDFCFHLTFTESLSYGVVDAINAGSLPIVSRQVSDYFKLPKILTINNIDAADSLSLKLAQLYRFSNTELNSLLNECRARLRITAEMNNAKLRFLTEAIDIM